MAPEPIAIGSAEPTSKSSARPIMCFKSVIVLGLLSMIVLALSLFSFEVLPNYTRKADVAYFMTRIRGNITTGNANFTQKDVSTSLQLEHKRSEEAGSTTTTHWCVIDQDKIPLSSSRFNHFPHTMEIVLPCWSWFRQTHSTDNCGFVLVGNLRFDVNGNGQPDIHSWQNQLVQSHMKCQIRHVSSFNASIVIKTDEGVYHEPNLMFMRPRFGQRNYLRDTEDAQALRRAVGVSDEWVSLQKGHSHPLQIGILQRKQRRRVLNMPQIAEGLQEALPDANVTLSSFDKNDSSKGPPSLLEQAQWFASKDVIVAAHGAALTNCVFITKGTLVVQLYPPPFYWQFYDPLIEQSGGLSLGWTKGEDPITDFVALKHDWRLKNAVQHQDFEVPVEEVLDIVMVALERQMPSRDMIQHYTY